MDMVDMKLTPKEVKEEKAEVRSIDVPPYPWGLCIRLEKDELDKLKLASLPNVGDEVHITAVGRVTGVSSSMRDQKDEDKTVSIQIVMLALDDEGADDGDSVKAENAENKAKPKAKAKGTIMSMYGGGGD